MLFHGRTFVGRGHRKYVSADVRQNNRLATTSCPVSQNDVTLWMRCIMREGTATKEEYVPRLEQTRRQSDEVESGEKPHRVKAEQHLIKWTQRWRRGRSSSSKNCPSLIV